MTHRPRVSVVVPAHDAAGTLAETLDSLLAQTDGDWEAVVVNDGSTDATGEIAAAYAGRDPRVRVVTQPQCGEGAARNAGIAVARGDWMLFLDADDWMAPDALEHFAAAIVPDVDAVIGGWERVTADGTHLRDPFRPDPTDLFPVLARFCPFAIHSCLVSAARVREAGGFEPGLRVGTDWDFWQRVARAGARFVAVDEVLAYYRVRAQSAAVNVPRLVEAGRRLIALGHAADPRVASPDPRYADGMPAAEAPAALLRFIGWPAGILIGAGEDAAPLLAWLDGARDPELEPMAVASALFWAALLPESTPPASWVARWPAAEPRVRAFLEALERTSGTRDLATRALLALARLALPHAPAGTATTLGPVHHVTIDVAVPIGDVAVDGSVDWLVATVVAGGTRVGDLELPACDGLVPAAVIADAVADQFGWPLLGRLFARSVYPTLELRPADGRVEAWRGNVRVAKALSEGTSVDSAAFHDAVGWTVFLQELWGEPERDSGWFYAGVQSVEAAPDATCVPFEISGPLGDLSCKGSVAAVELRVGGTPVALVPVRASEGVVPAAAVRGQVMRVGGYEVARAAVREGIIGRPLDERMSLRARLAEAAARAAGSSLPRWAADLADGALVLGRRAGAVGTAASRRAVLPAAAADALRQASRVHAHVSTCVRRVLYVPELLDAAQSKPKLKKRTAPLRKLKEILRRYRSQLSAMPNVEAPAARFLMQGEGGEPRRGNLPAAATHELPILMYHSVAPDGASGFARHRVTPAALEAQLRHLRDAGFRSVTLDEWRRAKEAWTPLDGRAVMLTFDDGFRDFAEHAWPLLRRYGFAALVFLVTDHVGGTNAWDAAYGEPAPLLDWDTVRRLQSEGVVFGSHTATHRFLTGVSPAEIVREAARSRAVLARELGREVDAIAYPHGAEDPAIQHLVGACGYTYGLSRRAGRSRLVDPLLALCRIEVRGGDTLHDFVRKLG